MTRHQSHRQPAPALFLAILLAAALLAAAPAGASDHVLALTPADTHIGFVVEATGHDVHGSFALRDGEIHFDPATGSASGRIAVDAAHAETGNGSRDKTMHHKVLESGRYPLFVFEAKSFEGELPTVGEGEVILHGTLAIHGGKHPLDLPAKVVREGDEVHAVTTFEVPYEEWGMHNPSLLFLRVADRVVVTVEADGTLRDAGSEMAAGSR